MSDQPSKPRFLLGEQVCVRPGVTDPDYPDLTIGGWAGEVVEVEHGEPSATYLIRWSEATLKQIPKIHRKRSERDGFEIEEMWLGEDDLEPNTGGHVKIEQPTNVITKPLSDNVQEDRIRAVFGLTSDDPLPEVDEETLDVYAKHLNTKLRFPFHAIWSPESGPPEHFEVAILGLGDRDAGTLIDDFRGVMCQAKLQGRIIEVPLAECEATKSGAPKRLLEDYAFWFWSH